MDKPRMTLSDWEAEAYTRYLTQTTKKKKKTSLKKPLNDFLQVAGQNHFIKKFLGKKPWQIC